MSKVELYLDETQIESLNSILKQSENGLHVLFENSLINEVFKEKFTEDEFFQIENIKKVQGDLLHLLNLKSLFDKQGYISSLKKEDRHRIVRAYFYIIENNIKLSHNFSH